MSNVVFMGQGEPFFNYRNVKKSLQILTHEKGLNYSARKITVSTSGTISFVLSFSLSYVQVSFLTSTSSLMIFQTFVLQYLFTLLMMKFVLRSSLQIHSGLWKARTLASSPFFTSQSYFKHVDISLRKREEGELLSNILCLTALTIVLRRLSSLSASSGALIVLLILCIHVMSGFLLTSFPDHLTRGKELRIDRAFHLAFPNF